MTETGVLITTVLNIFVYIIKGIEPKQTFCSSFITIVF